ncbi:MAG TPA: hypothetical protein DCS07_05525 [Bdellovibrionales bacterium]|nr:MAG: hypothetical protein A2Z97_00015 [Bdellovibrionales bacterium GWB1_52_6]OFZ04524.1 MAG: hypothetical protein A2X97_12930 [Bdellovibrionales bacterium GWA1_52_35]OFZ39662.1 MAG: hypothetical protein A2070_02085 [Bdellovibrionales bacterium GWC1_52_8]HAR42079.1 hypothetical protein [Bdellovibrionales bacterium]HCM39928.1 hypothetical protein [Bdellovibrionales bacterium]
MEDQKRVARVFAASLALAFSCSAFAVQPREVVLFGTFLGNKHIVITRALQAEQDRVPSGIQKYRTFSSSGYRKGTDRLVAMKVELWNSSYLLGTCQPAKSAQPARTRNLTLEFSCVLTNNPKQPRTALLSWGKKKKGSPSLHFRSWISGDSTVEVKVDYDAIGG